MLIVMKLIAIVYLLLCFCNYLDAMRINVTLESNELMKRKTSDNIKSNSSGILNTSQMIRKAGYPVETHVITTEDGYLLTLHRIPGGNDSLPVLLLHCFLCTSAIWVFLGNGKALAYLLADQGYDVWLGNHRGNVYSKAHVSLSPSESKFWDFSFNEMGIYDLPAIITFITNMRSKPLHTYIGHSMGSSTFYVMAAERPDIARKVEMMISLAPPVFVNHMKSPLRDFLISLSQYEVITQFLLQDILSQNDFVRSVTKYACDYYFQEICADMIFLACGYDPEQFSYTMQSIILEHLPSSCSAKTFKHFAQAIVSGKFCQYDYGYEKNLLMYNSSEPPDYDITNITVPIALFYSLNDLLVDHVDVKRLYNTLPNVVDMYEVPWSKFNHGDFVWGNDADKLVYRKVLQLMRERNTHK